MGQQLYTNDYVVNVIVVSHCCVFLCFVRNLVVWVSKFTSVILGEVAIAPKIQLKYYNNEGFSTYPEGGREHGIFREN
jgi:hypothetical protein